MRGDYLIGIATAIPRELRSSFSCFPLRNSVIVEAHLSGGFPTEMAADLNTLITATDKNAQYDEQASVLCQSYFKLKFQIVVRCKAEERAVVGYGD